jgi:hypothetical protein
MTAFHKALAAALLCGAVGFALPGNAQNTGTSTSSGTTTENGAANATGTTNSATNPVDTGNTANANNAGNTANGDKATNKTAQAKETKGPARVRRAAATRPKGGSEAKEHEIVESLNQQSLQAFQNGSSSPSFTDTEAGTQQATTATTRNGKASGIKTRARKTAVRKKNG